jgi:hypothetical protein
MEGTEHNEHVVRVMINIRCDNFLSVEIVDK